MAVYEGMMVEVCEEQGLSDLKKLNLSAETIEYLEKELENKSKLDTYEEVPPKTTPVVSKVTNPLTKSTRSDKFIARHRAQRRKAAKKRRDKVSGHSAYIAERRDYQLYDAGRFDNSAGDKYSAINKKVAINSGLADFLEEKDMEQAEAEERAERRVAYEEAIEKALFFESEAKFYRSLAASLKD